MGLSIWISLTLPFRTLIRAKKTGLDSPIGKSDGQMVLRIVRDRVGVILNSPPLSSGIGKYLGMPLSAMWGVDVRGERTS